MLNITEYKELENASDLIKQHEKEWIENGGKDEDSEEEFEFVDECDMSQTYFTLTNESRRVMKKGTQAWNCYGNLTNKYLLVNYGFCF